MAHELVDHPTVVGGSHSGSPATISTVMVAATSTSTSASTTTSTSTSTPMSLQQVLQDLTFSIPRNAGLIVSKILVKLLAQL